VLFRGPRREVAQPYAVALGGTETYGKFVPQPFPALVEDAVGLPLLNLGNINAGLDLFLNDPEVLGIARGARVAVVQVVGAANLSNQYYRVHPRRNDRFVQGSPLLRALFREVDLTEFHFTRHLMLGLHRASAERFDVVAAELRATWVERMRSLLRTIPGRKILLWVGASGPPQDGVVPDLWQDPMLVTAKMLDAVRPLADTLVEVRPSAEALSAGTAGMAFSPLEEPAARHVPGPAMHHEIAAALAPVLRQYL
jgi:hypothetical protein